MENNILGIQILSVILIIIVVIGLIGLVFVKIPNDSKKSLLDDLLKNNEITKETYVKYIKKLN